MDRWKIKIFLYEKVTEWWKAVFSENVDWKESEIKRDIIPRWINERPTYIYQNFPYKMEITLLNIYIDWWSIKFTILCLFCI